MYCLVLHCIHGRQIFSRPLVYSMATFVNWYLDHCEAYSDQVCRKLKMAETISDESQSCR
jgi:hypothetical protein